MRPTASQLLKKAKTPSFLVSSRTNVRYLSGFADEGALCLVSAKGFSLFVSPLEYEAAKDKAYKGVHVRNSRDLEKAFRRVRRCGFEEEDVTVARMKRWKKHFSGTAFTPVSGVIEEYRRTKDEAELTALVRANAITEEILGRIPALLQPGITERALAWTIEEWAREMGAQGMSFESIVAFGTHTSRPHHRPTERKLLRGHLVQIDIGARYNGYCGDRSAVYFTKAPTAEQSKVLSALEEARNTAIDLIAPGVKAADIDAAARKVLKKHGFEKYFIHSLGHGVGLDIHEGINLSGRSKQSLLEHEVVTVEPGIYFPGKFGMRLEDMVIVQ